MSHDLDELWNVAAYTPDAPIAKDAGGPSARPLLTTNYEARKALPVVTGVLDYFPDAIAAVAAVSKAGNDQHNPGEPLHWARHKSLDHVNCIGRHVMERGTIDTDQVRHMAKAAWRALAELQTEIECERSGMTRTEYDKHLAAGGRPA